MQTYLNLLLILLKRMPAGLAALLFAHCLSAQTLFDTHLHYTSSDAVRYSAEQIIQILENNGIHKAVVTGTPSEYARRLHRYAPGSIIPLLGVYQAQADKTSWTRDTGLVARIEKELKKARWGGIGELHVFAKDRHSRVFKRIIELAQEYQLPLLLHVDPAVIDTLYELAPAQSVIWAHAGAYPYPDLIADYLERYPSLNIDLSMRNERIAPNGQILDEWYELFVTHPERFMIGVDTYSTSRWVEYEHTVNEIRRWLAQLPVDTAVRLAYENADRLFKAVERK